MKKFVSIIFLIILIAGTILSGCKKEDNIISENNNEKPEITVKAGILQFTDSTAMQNYLNKIGQMTVKEANEWENKIGFHSIRRYQNEAENLILQNIEKILRSKSTLTVNSLQKKVFEGKMNDIPEKAQKIIDLCGFSVITNADSTRELRINTNSTVNYRILNADYMYAIDGELHYFKDNKELIANNWNINSISKLKYSKDQTLRNKIVQITPYIRRISKYRKLYGQLCVARTIYWTSKEKDVWSYTRLYLDYYAVHKHWYWYTWQRIAIEGDGQYSKAVKYKNWVGEFNLYSEDIANTTTQSPYYIYRNWAFDGDFSWFAFKDAWFSVKLVDEPSVKIVLEQYTGSNKNPAYLYNVRGGISYERHHYSSPGDIH